MDFAEIIDTRHSVRDYEPDVPIADTELAAIFERVVLSPSSFNLQHWRFVVVREPERKRELRGLAFGQAQVEACSAAIVVCGHLDAHADAARIYADEAESVRDKYVPMIEAVYADNETLAREEVIRSGALAAMTLMYAARDRGWDTGPMIGFDAGKVAAMLGLDARTVPVMLVVLGRARGGVLPHRAYRRPVSEVVRLESMQGAALGGAD